MLDVSPAIHQPHARSTDESLLEKLQIDPVNPGACSGPDGWIEIRRAELVSYNPTTGQPIARVAAVHAPRLSACRRRAQAAFLDWRETPAPARGQLVRDFGRPAARVQGAPGDLVSLEMGKIRAEGHGEVQEMIDICDFAVGLSRQLYGLTMPSERPHHRMYRTVASARVRSA